MPVVTGWYEMGRVYYLQFSGVVIADDVRWAIRLSCNALEPYQEAIGHSVTDVSQVTGFDLPLRVFINALDGLHEIKGSGWAVVVGNKATFVNFSLKAASQYYRFQMISFSDLEAGLNFLNRVDNSLPPLLPPRPIQWQARPGLEYKIL